MGEADESTPAVLIRNAPVRFIDGSEDIPVISREGCMYFGCFRG
jgi:F420-0:gamma-glutamyl ligase